MKNLKALSLLPFVLLLLSALAPEALGCSCIQVRRPFLMVAPASPWVVRGRVVRHTGGDKAKHQPHTEMDVEVLEVFVGEVSQKVITISGDPGNLCRPYVSRFPVGTEWMLALEPTAKSMEATGGYLMMEPDKGDYTISNCGTYWLAVKDGKVVGDILVTPGSGEQGAKPETHKLSLGELRNRFEAAKKNRPATDGVRRP